METASSAPGPPRSAEVALLFTDASRRVVFVDQQCLLLLGYSESSEVVGEPVYKALRMSAEGADRLIDEVARQGYVAERPLELRDAAGRPLIVLCSGMATYDHNGGFIGADLTLRRLTVEAPFKLLTTHWDVLSARIQQIRAEAERQQAEMDQMWSQLYFTAHLSALQVLLARMGGPRVRAALDTLVNDAARKRRWTVSIQGNRIVVQDSPTAEAYRVLLAEAVLYGVNIVGWQVVEREIEAVDRQLGAECLSAADRLGLRPAGRR